MRQGLWPCTVPPILRYLKHSDSPIQPDPRGRCIGRLPSPPPDCVFKGSLFASLDHFYFTRSCWAVSRPIYHPSAGVCDRDHFIEHRTASLCAITTWPVCLKLPSHYSKYQEVVVRAQRFMTQPPTPLQSYLPGSHDIMYLLTCELAVSRFATARVGSPNRPDFAGHKNRGGARRSHFCGSA